MRLWKQYRGWDHWRNEVNPGYGHYYMKGQGFQKIGLVGAPTKATHPEIWRPRFHGDIWISADELLCGGVEYWKATKQVVEAA